MENCTKYIITRKPQWGKNNEDSVIISIKKVHGDRFKPGDLVWLFEPHRAKSRKFYLPWQGPYEMLNRTIEVTYKICDRARPERWTKVHFNRLKPYIGEPEVRRSIRNEARPMPLYEEIPSVSDESDKEMEDRPFHVFSGTSAETRANCNRPRVTFEMLPVVIEENQTENDDREVSHPYEEIPPRQPSPPIATFEQIDERDSDDKISVDSRPRVPFENARERPETLAIRDVDESNSDMPPGRSIATSAYSLWNRRVRQQIKINTRLQPTVLRAQSSFLNNLAERESFSFFLRSTSHNVIIYKTKHDCFPIGFLSHE